MVVEAVVQGEQAAERKRLESLLERILPVVRTADAIARAIVGKVRTVALLGSLAALWLAFAAAHTFGFGLAGTLPIVMLLMLPALVLWKMHATLRATIGLPQRVIDTSGRLFGKLAEYRQLYEERGAAPPQQEKPRFRQLWQTTRSILELKSLGDEGREILSTVGGAVVMTNPLFAVVLFVTMTIELLIAAVAALVVVAYVL